MISFSGLSSGLDTGAIIDQLVSLERSRANVYQSQKTTVNRQISAVGNLTSKLQELDSKLEDFTTANSVRVMAASSSDDTRVAVSTDGSALAGTFSLRVNNLAVAETTASSEFATPDAGVVGDGSVTLTVGANDPVTVNYTATSSLYDIADSINNSGAGAGATVLFDGSNYRLLVTASETGLANAMTFSESGSSLGFTAVGAELVTAEDASITMNGLNITRSSNTISDVVSGVTLDLKSEHGAGDVNTAVEVKQDLEETSTKLQEFVDSYNAIADLLQFELGFKGEGVSQSSLFGDSTLRSLQRAMSSIIGTGYSHDGDITSLGLIGIQVDNVGHLSIDQAKLEATLTSDPTAIDELFAGESGGSGLTQALADLVDTYTRAGDGILVTKTSSLNGRIDIFDEQIERIESSASNLNDRLVRQFTALEEALVSLQSQQSTLSSFGF